MTNYEANDKIREMCALYWNANANITGIGYIPELRFAGTEQPDLPEAGKFWGRLSTATTFEAQDTISTCVGGPHKVRYEVTGVLTLQLFAPRNVPNSAFVLERLADVMQGAYRAKSFDTLWFRNVRVNDGFVPEPLWYRSDVIADYEFNKIA